MRVWVDIETRSDLPLNKVGLYRYAESPQTRVILISWAVEDDPPRQWTFQDPATPAELFQLASDSRVEFHAWNAEFEARLLTRVLSGVGLSRWRCDMAQARMLALPSSLDAAGAVVGLPADKQKLRTGRALIRLFCAPLADGSFADPKDHPEKWREFCEYNKQDVVANRAVWRRLRKWPLPCVEQHVWEDNILVNARGLPVDVPLVKTAIHVAEAQKAAYLQEMKDLTGLENPNSLPKLRESLGQHGLLIAGLRKAQVKQALDRSDLTGVARRVLVLRSLVARTSVDKYKALERGVRPDTGCLSGCFGYAGAGRTGRWAGQLFQPQNLPQGRLSLEDAEQACRLLSSAPARPEAVVAMLYDDPLEVLSSCIRGAICAPPGHVFCVADWSGIENRILGWISRCGSLLSTFERGLDPYVAFASLLYQRPYSAITAKERKVAKPAVLGCGYMLGGGDEDQTPEGDTTKSGLWGYAAGTGVEMTRDEAHRAVQVFRDSYPEIVRLWEELDRACRKCISTHAAVDVAGGRLRVQYEKPFMVIRLPSGRGLYYCHPRLVQAIPPWERKKAKPERRLTIAYDGVRQQTKTWGEVTTHPGKLTENVVQGIARDVLAHTLLRLRDNPSAPVVGHVHDEILLLSRDGDADLAWLRRTMATPMPWAKDLALPAAGFVSRRYRK
jgi:DNA polymerase